MKTFNEFVNENIRSAMKGKNDDDIKKLISKLNTSDKIAKLKKNNIDNIKDYISKKELDNYLAIVDFEAKIKLIGINHLPKEEIKEYLSRFSFNDKFIKMYEYSLDIDEFLSKEDVINHINSVENCVEFLEGVTSYIIDTTYGIEYPDQVYFYILEKMGLNFIKNNIDDVIDYMSKLRGFRSEIFNKFKPKTKDFETFREFRDFIFEIEDEAGDISYRDETLKQLIEKYDLNKVKKLFIDLIGRKEKLKWI